MCKIKKLFFNKIAKIALNHSVIELSFAATLDGLLLFSGALHHYFIIRRF